MKSSDSVERFRPGRFSYLKNDLPAGLVVFLVALPLCVGIATASGAPLFSGVISGIVGGTLVALLSGSALAVSGPATALIVVSVGAIHTMGTFEAFLAAVALSGVLQLFLAWVGFGRLSAFFPVSVIRGMLAAVGLIVIFKQIPHALGRDVDFEGDFSVFGLFGGENTFADILRALSQHSLGAILVCLASLGTLLVWDRRSVARLPWVGSAPAPVVAVVAGVLLNEGFRLFWPTLHLAAGSDHLLAVPELAWSGMGAALRHPDFSALAQPATYAIAGLLALMGSAETLLCVEAMDKLDRLRRISPKARELLAQGAGNLVAGLLGGLPITAVVLRSSASVHAGAMTRLAALTHGVLLFSTVLLVPSLLNRIPLAALSAVLFSVGYRLTGMTVFRQIYRQGMNQFIPFVATFMAILATDVLIGVMIGLAVGVLMMLKTNHQSAIVVVSEGDNTLIKFTKDVSFVNKARLKSELEGIRDGSSLLVDGTRAHFIDHDIYEALVDFKEWGRHRGIAVEFRNLVGKNYSLRIRGKRF